MTAHKMTVKDGMKRLAARRTMQIGIIPLWEGKRVPRQLGHSIRKGTDTVTVVTTEKYGCVGLQTPLNAARFANASHLQLVQLAMLPLALQIPKLVRVVKQP